MRVCSRNEMNLKKWLFDKRAKAAVSSKVKINLVFLLKCIISIVHCHMNIMKGDKWSNREKNTTFYPYKLLMLGVVMSSLTYLLILSSNYFSTFHCLCLQDCF